MQTAWQKVQIARASNRKTSLDYIEKIFDEFSKFVGCRLLTLGMEIVLMYVFVSLFKINDMIAKIILQVIILILNYVFSKFFVFVKTKK